MPDINDYQVYNDRMRRSMWDKAFFMDKVPGAELIIDYGCADGSLIQFLHELFPAMRFIGFDIDPAMVALARARGIENAWFFHEMADVHSTLQTLGIPGERVAINFSSVFHEVFHYGFDLAALGGFVRGIDPQYIVVRDMMYHSDNDQALVSEEALYRVLDPSRRYRRILFNRYILPWCRIDAEERFHLDLGDAFTTHFSLILSARRANDFISLNEGGKQYV